MQKMRERENNLQLTIVSGEIDMEHTNFSLKDIASLISDDTDKVKVIDVNEPPASEVLFAGEVGFLKEQESLLERKIYNIAAINDVMFIFV